jgi:hypothetical protein
MVTPRGKKTNGERGAGSVRRAYHPIDLVSHEVHRLEHP